MINRPAAQTEKFKQAACELEADQDETRSQDRLKKVAKHKPIEERPE
jgi:hypothetical protein